jgi:hypothetical protein
MTFTNRSAAGQTVPSWVVYMCALAAVSVVSRLPQLLSPNLLLDGDECILGLMGRHVAQAHDFPVFFYGQNYGLAIVEAPAAAVSFLILGPGAVPLKLAMLALWIGGVVMCFLAFSRPLGHTRSFWLTLILVLMPAWAVSSMKAWSGYITAFAAASAVFYLMMHADKPRAVRWLIAGGLTAIIYYSQPSWLPGLAPILIFFLISSRRLSSWAVCGSGMVGMFVSIALMKMALMPGAAESWTRPEAGNPELFGSLPAVMKQVYVNLTGSYYLRTAVDPGPVTAIVAYLWLGVLAAALLLQIVRLLTRRYLLWSHLLCASVVATQLANWLLLDARDARYMLSMNMPLVFLAGIEFLDFADRHRLSNPRRVATIALVLALEGVSAAEFARFTYMWWTNPKNGPSEQATIEKVVGYMRARGARHAYSMNALLQWQMTFYSREAIVARWTASADRYPAYIREVDRALDNGEAVAVVGYVGYTNGFERLVPDPQAIVEIDGKYFVYFGANKELLKRARFRFAN